MRKHLCRDLNADLHHWEVLLLWTRKREGASKTRPQDPFETWRLHLKGERLSWELCWRGSPLKNKLSVFPGLAPEGQYSHGCREPGWTYKQNRQECPRGIDVIGCRMKWVMVMESCTRELLKSGTTCQDHGKAVVSCKHGKKVSPKRIRVLQVT